MPNTEHQHLHYYTNVTLVQLHDMKNNAVNVSHHPIMSEVVDWKELPQTERETTLGRLLAECSD